MTPRDERLQLYNLEGCPFCDMVREVLDDLEIEYVVHEVARPRFKRDRVWEISGQPLVPVLVDPKHGVVMPESSDIVTYLMEHYGPG